MLVTLNNIRANIFILQAKEDQLVFDMNYYTFGGERNMLQFEYDMLMALSEIGLRCYTPHWRASSVGLHLLIMCNDFEKGSELYNIFHEAAIK